MIQPGLCSVTFRRHSVPEIITLATNAGLAGIEWGGDVHVPHGDLALAEETRQRTIDAGLKVASYGSYYNGIDSAGSGLPFEKVLDTALALGAPTIRAWAGKIPSAETDAAYRAQLTECLCRDAETAARSGVRIALEFHGGTLTDTTESTTELLKTAGHPNLGSYWQPPVGMNFESCRESLTNVLPWLRNLHVFHWTRPENQILRHALADGRDAWKTYLKMADSTNNVPGERFALLEFVQDDSPEAFQRDAAALLQFLA